MRKVWSVDCYAVSLIGFGIEWANLVSKLAREKSDRWIVMQSHRLGPVLSKLIRQAKRVNGQNARIVMQSRVDWLEASLVSPGFAREQSVLMDCYAVSSISAQYSGER